MKNYEPLLQSEKSDVGNSYVSPDFTGKSTEEILPFFGYSGFKPQQLEIINRIINREGDTLGIMPTGGGKSLCYHIPALILPNLTVIVSPLIALMKDQIDALAKKKIPAFFLNSTLSYSLQEKILGEVENKKIKILYLAPESLKSERVLDILRKTKIDLFVIDEAHCISTWGHNFRPDYLRIKKILEILDNPLVLALTATATKEVKEDIQQQLGRTCQVFQASFDRPNLYFEVIPVADNVKKEVFLIELVRKLNGPSIIFATYQKTTEKLAEISNAAGINCQFYHAGLSAEEREKRQNQFINGECQIIVATIAFGMGIDKADVRNVVHYNLPQSIENYYQEMGRAGRDGFNANCLLLYTPKDAARIKNLLADGWPDALRIKEIIDYLGHRDYIFTTTKKIQLDCEIKEIAANLILHRMEENGSIKIYPSVPFQIKLSLNKKVNQIIQENHDNEELKKILGSSFFKNPRRKWLLLEEVMQETSLHYFRILEILKHLRKKGDVKFEEVGRKDFILLNNINNLDVDALADLFQSLLQHDLQKIDALVQVITSAGCLRKKILSYFGEEMMGSCQMCSNCLSKKMGEISPAIDENYLEDAEPIPLNIADIPLVAILKLTLIDRFTLKNLIQIFSGKIKYPVSLRSKEVIEKIVNWCLEHKLVQEEVDGRFRLTKKGYEYLLKANV